MVKKSSKGKSKGRTSKDGNSTGLEVASDGFHKKLPDLDHYKLLFFESEVNAAKNKLAEQRTAFELWRLEMIRKQESFKQVIASFANKLRDMEVRYNSTLAEMSNTYGIDWTKVALQADGTIFPLEELKHDDSVAATDGIDKTPDGEKQAGT